MSQEPDFYDSINIAEEEEQLRQIDESVIELNSIIEEMDLRGGVSKQTAIDLESLQPGLISNKRPINSYTRDYTRTNFKATLEDAETMRKGLFYAGIAALAMLFIKILSWIFGGSSDSGSGGGGGGGGGKNKEQIDKIRVTVTFTRKLMSEFDKVGKLMNEIIEKYPKQAVSYVPTAAAGAFNTHDLGSSTQISRFLKDIDHANRFRAIQTHGAVYFIDLVDKPGVVVDDLRFLCDDVPIMLIEVGEKLGLFQQALQEKKDLRKEDYVIKYRGRLRQKNIQNYETFKEITDILVKAKEAWFDPQKFEPLFRADLDYPLEKLLTVDYQTNLMEQAEAHLVKAESIQKTAKSLAQFAEEHKTKRFGGDSVQTTVAKEIQIELHGNIADIAKLLNVLKTIRTRTVSFTTAIHKSAEDILKFYERMHELYAGDKDVSKSDAAVLASNTKKLREVWKKTK